MRSFIDRRALRASRLAVVAAIAMASCKPSARPPIDASVVPQGTGWFCYQHEEPGSVRELCWRDRDECAARGSADGNKPCTPVDQAFCTDLQPAAAHDVRCLGTQEDCEAIAQATAGATQCSAAP